MLVPATRHLYCDSSLQVDGSAACVNSPTMQPPVGKEWLGHRLLLKLHLVGTKLSKWCDSQ